MQTLQMFSRNQATRAHGRSVVFRSLFAILGAGFVAVPSTAAAQIGSVVGGVIGGLSGFGSLGTQTVYDPTAVGKLAVQLGQQLQQITVARDHLQAQLDNMRKLGRYDVRDVNRTMSQIDVLTQQGQALSYSLATVERDFQSTFSGTLPGGRISAAMRSNIQTQNQRTLATAAATIAAARETAQQFGVATAQLNGIRSQLGSISSAQQAAELNGLIGIHTAQELTLLRQQLAAQGNAQVVMMANQVNRDLQGAAAAQAIQEEATRAPIRRKDMRVETIGFPTRGTP